MAFDAMVVGGLGGREEVDVGLLEDIFATRMDASYV